jgi:hypothetical protein
MWAKKKKPGAVPTFASIALLFCTSLLLLKLLSLSLLVFFAELQKTLPTCCKIFLSLHFLGSSSLMRTFCSLLAAVALAPVSISKN